MTRRAALAVGLAALLVLAGCTGTGPATTTPGEETTATPDPTTQRTTDAAEPTTDATQSGTTDGPTANATERRIQADALAAMDDVESYRVRAASNRSLSANNARQQVQVESVGTFDRTTRRLHVNQTNSGPGGVVAIETYVVDEALYRHSEAYVRQYDSEWITQDISENFSSVWRTQDTLTRQRAVLANASVEVTGTEVVEGTEAYVVEADVNVTSYNEVVAARTATGSVDVANVSFTFWLSTERHLPLRSVGTVESTLVQRGQEVTVVERVRLAFSAYDAPVSISLPEGAETAVSLDNSTSATTAAVAPPRPIVE